MPGRRAEVPVFYSTERIMEVACPRCHAAPHKFCNRQGDWLNDYGRAMLAKGQPPSHQERMWARQGHDPSEFRRMRRRIKPGEFPQKRKGARRERPLPFTAQQLAALANSAARRVICCPSCRQTRPADTVTFKDGRTACRCGCGHMWLTKIRMVA